MRRALQKWEFHIPSRSVWVHSIQDLKQYQEAKQHAEEAKKILFNVEPGEDSAFANYCDACVLVESLSENPTLKEIKEVEGYFMIAIDDARSHHSGIDLVAPHSFMRLAQMNLGSTHYTAGSISDKDSVGKAADYLRNVDRSRLCIHSRCHFHLIESDLYRSKKMLSESKRAAHDALDAARKHNFTNEIMSAENRLKALQVF